MNNNKYAPGPWIIDDNFIRTSDGKGGNSVALGNTNRKEWRANVRLIASAPDLKEQRDELLEACMWLVYLMHDIGKNGGRPSDTEYEKAGDFAKAAIDKATGKEQT